MLGWLLALWAKCETAEVRLQLGIPDFACFDSRSRFSQFGQSIHGNVRRVRIIVDRPISGRTFSLAAIEHLVGFAELDLPRTVDVAPPLLEHKALDARNGLDKSVGLLSACWPPVSLFNHARSRRHGLAQLAGCKRAILSDPNQHYERVLANASNKRDVLRGPILTQKLRNRERIRAPALLLTEATGARLCLVGLPRQCAGNALQQGIYKACA
jgi:hypothetical protein